MKIRLEGGAAKLMAIVRARESRAANPDVGLWFGALVPEMAGGKAVEVARALIAAMSEAKMSFDGFSLWGETADIESFVREIRNSSFVR
jgi:hypothetical protein